MLSLSPPFGYFVYVKARATPPLTDNSHNRISGHLLQGDANTHFEVQRANIASLKQAVEEKMANLWEFEVHQELSIETS